MKVLGEIKKRILGDKDCIIRGGVTKLDIVKINEGELLKDRKILITGGGSGIGGSIAKACKEQGAMVVLIGRNRQNLQKIQAELGEKNCKIITGDIQDKESIKRIYDDCEDKAGVKVDSLVNCAGIVTSKKFFEIDQEEWNSILDTNVKGTFFMCQEFLKRKDDIRKNAKIINISSICGEIGADTPYGISKWGINGLTKGLARDFISESVIVNGIAPGNVATRVNTIDAAKNAYTTENKFNRIILPEEVAQLAVFLLSDLSNSIIGQVITIDGGTTLI